ncbi:MAG: hypothetical protein LBC97_04000 [Bifidobacteriaceae bacterium]|jgi:hypothetical protein|nr:hypothetical protein [Bifidobacteriaceae bacterium]
MTTEPAADAVAAATEEHQSSPVVARLLDDLETCRRGDCVRMAEPFLGWSVGPHPLFGDGPAGAAQ